MLDKPLQPSLIPAIWEKFTLPLGTVPLLRSTRASPVKTPLGPYLKDRVRDTTTSPGTGSATLTGTAPSGSQTFLQGIGDQNYTVYTMQDQLGGPNWETGLGQYLNSGPVLVRLKVLDGTNGPGVLVNFASGTQDVWADWPGTLASPVNTNYNVKLFGAKGDVLTVKDGVMTIGSAVLTSTSNQFSATDVGKLISVRWAGTAGNNQGVANYLISTIASYQGPGQVTLVTPASNTVNSCEVFWGTDDAVAINAAMSAASNNGGGIVYIPPGTYFVGTAIIWYSHTHIQGAGIDTTNLMLAPGAACDIIVSYAFASLTLSNKQAGINSCSIKDLSINGWYYHGSFLHTQVNATLNSADTTLTVLSTTGFPPNGGKLLVYDNLANQPGEAISYSGTSPTTFTGLTRAQENTIAQQFTTGQSVDLRATGGVFQAGYGLRVYGYGYVIERVRFHDCEQDGYYSEWSSVTGTVQPDALMSHVYDVNVHTNNGNGIWWQGPHDSIIIDAQVYSNSFHGIRSGPLAGTASGLIISTSHSYGNQNYAYSLENFTLLYNCVGEQGIAGQVYVNTSQTQIVGCFFFASPTQIFTRGIVLGTGAPAFCVIDAMVLDCNQGTIDFTNDGGNNYFRLQIRQQAGGNVFIGAPATSSNMTITELPGNYNALTGENTQFAGPAILRSLQGATQTLIVRAPFTQSVNIFETQNTGGVGITVIDKNGMLGINKAVPTFGLHQIGGSQRLVAVPSTAAPTATPFPTGGGTTYTYFIVSEDIAGNKALVSPSGATTTGPASLAATTFVRVTWGAVPGAIKYYVLKTNNTTLLGTVSASIGGVVTQVAVGAGGSGYTGSAPTIGFSGPPQNQTQATSTVAGGVVTGITVTTGQMGTGFTSVPNVVVGGPGSGATATANMGASNISSVGAGGTVYAVNDTITLTGGTFATATVLKVTSVAAGVVTGVAVQTPGSYSVLPSNPVSQGSSSGAGTSATFNVLWGISSVTVTAAGTGYSSAPAIGFNGGGALPVVTAVLASNALSAVSLTSGGVGYTGSPTVVIQGVAAGSGATATCSIATLSLDDTGQATSSFVPPARNTTADVTIDGNITATSNLPTIGSTVVGNVGLGGQTASFGIHQLGGSQHVVALATPAAPTTSVGGGTPAGATDFYSVVAEDRNGFQTLASPASSSAARGGSAINWRKVVWTAVPGAVKYYVTVNTSAPVLVNTLMTLTGTWIPGTITGVSNLVGGTGGSNGTFTDGTFTGGGGSSGTFGYTISGGIVTNIVVLNGGTAYTSNPTFTMPSAGSLTGFSATANIAAFSIAGGTNLEADDSGQAINGTLALIPRNTTADATVDGNVIVNAIPCIAVGCAFTMTASVTANTNAAGVTLVGTGVGTMTLPANFLVAGRTVRLKAWGTIISPASPSVTTFLVKVGSVTVATTSAFTPTASIAAAKTWYMECEFCCRTTGSSGTVFTQGVVRTDEVINPLVTSSLADWEMQNTATNTIDTTASQLVDFQVTQATNTANTIVATNLTMEILN